MLRRNNTRKRIDQLLIRIQLIEGLSVKYANAVEYKVLGRHSSEKQCLSKRKKFYKHDSTNCEEQKRHVCQKLCDVGLCVVYFFTNTTS